VSTDPEISARAKSLDVKVPFDIDVMVARVPKAIRPFPKTARFELFEHG